MTMTSNKARKIATRRRMAKTGEPYSVARKAAEASRSQQEPGETAEERYAREAAAGGVPAADVERLRLVWDAQARADQLRRAAERARERADQAEDVAAEAEERAEYGREAADLAQEWAGEHDRQLAWERANQMRRAADVARERADQAEEAAEQAEDAADEAEERADDLLAWVIEPGDWAEEDEKSNDAPDTDGWDYSCPDASPPSITPGPPLPPGLPPPPAGPDLPAPPSPPRWSG